MLNFIRHWASQGAPWPSIDAELGDLAQRRLFRGRVLNVGAGLRSVAHLVEGELVNQDMRWPGDTRTYIDVFSPLHDMPLSDASFDAVLCIAVLEHVINPNECVAEMVRVLKPGGCAVVSVPFLQPEHKVPTDYQRYTLDGLRHLLEASGLDIEEAKPMYSVFHSLHWLVFEWLHIKNSLAYRVLRPLLLIPLAMAARRSSLVSDKTASVFRVIARKPVKRSV
jgi:SAM-dependent methyltransferase